MNYLGDGIVLSGDLFFGTASLTILSVITDSLIVRIVCEWF